jgi:hypothetical protein
MSGNEGRSLLSPAGMVGRAVGAAKLGLKVAIWSEQQLLALLQGDVDLGGPRALPATPNATPAGEPLNAKMSRLLDRALNQGTRDSRAEFFQRLVDQLVADEARIVGALSDGQASPLVNVRSRSRESGAAELENASLIGRSASVALPALVPQYVSHLMALGLVEVGPEDPSMKADYEVLMAESPVLRAMKAAARGPMPARVEKLTLRLSVLGHDLWEATQEVPTA